MIAFFTLFYRVDLRYYIASFLTGITIGLSNNDTIEQKFNKNKACTHFSNVFTTYTGILSANFNYSVSLGLPF